MRILKTILYTAHLPELLVFYRDHLHLSIEETPGSFTIQLENSSLQFKTSSSPVAPVYHFAFHIPYHLVDEARIWLQQRVELLWLQDYNSYIAEFKNWDARSVYFLDPAGNVVEFIGRRQMNFSHDIPFSPAAIRDLSEIGIVLPEKNYLEERQLLMETYDLHDFECQPPAEHFAALGSHSSLLICVPENRNWYPCEALPARQSPMEIWLQNKGRTHHLSF